jgi:KDO2-lipid IV(A) lauroyltransferase
VLPVHATRRRDGRGYRLKIHPPLENFPTGVDEADALRINQLVETAVRETPEQYFWVHRRFKVPKRVGPGPYA